MKNFLIPVITFLGILALFFSCRSGKEAPDSYSRKQLIFGTGGGFTGAIEQYVLLENGYLYTHNVLSEEYQEIGKISKKACRKFFQQADTLDIASRSFSNPGNKYFYLEVKDSAHQNRITWGDNKIPIDEGYSKLYRSLMDMTREKK